MKTDELIRAYLGTRDKKEAIAKRHKEELAPYNEALRKIEALLQTRLLAEGLQNFSGQEGVAFLSKSTSVTVSEWTLTLPWIQEHNAWDLLEARVNKTALVDYHAEGLTVPGVKVTEELSVRVNRK